MGTVLLLLLLCAPAWGQFLFHETFEGDGATCARVETWTENEGTLTDSPGTMTGDCYLADPSSSNTTITTFDLGEGYAQFQYRKSANPSASDQIFRLTGHGCRVTQLSTGAGGGVRLENGGGSNSSASAALSNNTNYIIDVHWAKGTGSNAVCELRVNGGTVLSSTNGTWTANITAALLDLPTGISIGVDEIKLCTEGWIVDGGCGGSPPALSDAATFIGPWPGHSQILHLGGDSK